MIEKLDPLDQRPTVIIEKVNELIDALNQAWPYYESKSDESDAEVS